MQADRVARAIQLRWAPKRNVTASTLADDLDDFRRGSMRITRLWDDLLEEDDALATVRGKRFDALSRLRWEVLVDEDRADGRTAEAQRHREALEGFYSGLRATDVLAQDETGGVGLFARQVLAAKAHGFSTHEWIWKPAANGREYTTAEFRRCPPWWFENRKGQLRFLLQDYDFFGVEMDPNGWLVAAAPALMKPSSVLWLYKNLSLRDWLSFSEKFGMPGLVGETSADKGSPEWLAFKDALANFGPDWALVVNQGAKITPITAGSASLLPYPPLIEMLTRSIYALWLGGDLSTLSAQTGQGQGASLQGMDTAKIEDDDARFVSEVCQNRIDRAVIAYTFGEGVEPLAYFKLCPPTRQNVGDELKVDQFFAENGIPQERDAVYARYGRPLPDDGADVVFTSPVSTAPAGPLANEGASASEADVLKAMAADLAPVRKRLARILAIEDPEVQRERLLSLAREIPSLLRDINADPQSGRALEALLGAAVAQGMTPTAATFGNGDLPGHPFHGNQHVGGEGGGDAAAGTKAESDWAAAVSKKSGGRKRKMSIDHAAGALSEAGFSLGPAAPYQPGMGTRYRVTHKATGHVFLKTAAEIEKLAR